MRIKLYTAALLSFGALATAMPAEARVDQRQDRQQQRIYRGVGSGALNARETYRLERQQSRIGRFEARSRTDGGGLNWRERYRLERMQDRASRNIYRQKHDAQGR